MRCRPILLRPPEFLFTLFRCSPFPFPLSDFTVRDTMLFPSLLFASFPFLQENQERVPTLFTQCSFSGKFGLKSIFMLGLQFCESVPSPHITSPDLLPVVVLLCSVLFCLVWQETGREMSLREQCLDLWIFHSLPVLYFHHVLGHASAHDNTRDLMFGCRWVTGCVCIWSNWLISWDQDLHGFYPCSLLWIAGIQAWSDICFLDKSYGHCLACQGTKDGTNWFGTRLGHFLVSHSHCLMWWFASKETISSQL